MTQDWKITLRRSVVFTLLFGLAVHGFRFANLAFSHDATLVYQADDVWQIRLGRICQPAYLALRGRLVAPWLVGLLALLFLALAVFLVSGLLKLKSPISMAFLAGIMTSNVTLTYANASYLPWSDIYMLALLLAVLAVWLWENVRWGWLIGILPLALSIGLYGSYFQVAPFLMLVVLALDILRDKPEPKALVHKGLRALVTLLGALALYWALYHLTLKFLGLEVGTAYNSVVHAEDFSGVDIPALLGKTYLEPLRALGERDTFRPGVVAAVQVVLGILSVLGVVAWGKKGGLTAAHWWLLGGILAALPLAVNCVYFFSKGMTHGLMTYSFGLGLLCPLVLWEENGSKVRSSRWVVPILLSIILFCNTVYANQCYLKVALDGANTRSVLTRVLDRVEQTEGYVPGETQVALIGDLNQGPLAMTRPGFGRLTKMGLNYPFSTTNYVAYDYYFKYVLGYPINLVSSQEAQNYAELPEVQALESFPGKNCITMVDGVLVLRLSKPLRQS